MRQLIYFLIGFLLITGFAQAQETDTDTLRREERVEETAPRRDDSYDRRDLDEPEDLEREYILPKNELTWFQQGAFLGGASLGFGLGKGIGAYLAFSPRVAYFLQRGLAIGLRASFESRLSTSYRANQAGAFLRYYPIRNKFFLFAEGGFNAGRYKQSDVGPEDRRGYSSINLGLGLGFKALENLGFELVIENNYYDKTPTFAGRNRGPQLKLGANFHFGSRRYTRSGY